MKEQTVEYMHKREIESHKDLADELGFLRDEERTVKDHAIYTREVDGKVLTISFQNSKLYGGGIRVLLGLWESMDKYKLVNEINLCQSKLLEEMRNELGLAPRVSDKFFEASDLKNGGYQRLADYLKNMEQNGLLDLLGSH